MSDKKIVCTTTGVFIMPYEKGQSYYLEQDTSVYDKICHKYVPHTGFYNEKLGLFATYNMAKDKLRDTFKGYELIEMTNYKGKPLKYQYAMNVELNRYQNNAITQLMGINGHEAYVNIPTASGKTVLAVTYITMTNKKTLIMCYSSKILEQWVTTFKEKTDINPERVLELSSSEMMNAFLLPNNDKKKKKKPEDYDIFLCTTSMFDTFGKRYGYEKVQPLFMELGIGLKVIDEAHTRLGSTIRLNAYTSIDKTLYLSADFNQANKELMYHFKKVFKRVPVIKLTEELMNELRHITAVNCIFKSNPSAMARLAISANQYKWSNIEHAKYEFDTCKDMMKIINATIKAIVMSEKKIKRPRPYKILILTQLINHVDLIYRNLDTCGRSKSKLYASLDKENAITADIIVSTYKSFSTGLDVTNPQIRHVISTSPVDAVTANQSAGRCRPIPNLKSYFWMIQDYAFEYCSGNAERVLNYLKKNKIGRIREFDLRKGEFANAIQIDS